SKYREKDFAEHIVRECQRMGLKKEVFLPKKGDVFLWHAALCHEGTTANKPELTRLSFFTHYSSLPAYPRHRRKPDAIPTRYYYNGACVYGDPLRPELEDTFKGGEAF